LSYLTWFPAQLVKSVFTSVLSAHKFAKRQLRATPAKFCFRCVGAGLKITMSQKFRGSLTVLLTLLKQVLMLAFVN
jgi:hypothetical protein